MTQAKAVEDMRRDYKTVPEAAAILGVRPGTLYAYIYRRQVIPADAVQKVGTGWIIRADWIRKRKEKKGDTMKKLLTMESLTATYYDSGDHVLQFEPGDGRKIFVTVRGLGPVDDEYYWDDEDNLSRALAEVEEEDIRLYTPPSSWGLSL